MKKYTILFLLLSFSSLSAEYCKLDSISKEKVKSSVEKFISEKEIVGCTVGIIKKSEIVYINGHGFQDLKNQVKASEHTMYRTASIAKSITAVTALQLWEDSTLNILKDVREYVPEWPKKEKGTINAYRLMAHTSGVRHYDNLKEDLMDNYETNYFEYDPIAALDIFKESDLLFTPGTDYSYSTFGYNLLGAVIERSAGKPFLDQVYERINKAFGLPYLQAEYQRKRPYPNETRGYHFNKSDELKETGDDNGILYKVPGGGFICTATDLLLFSKAMMENKLYKDSTLFLWSAQKAHSRGHSFGLGIMNGTTNSRHYLWHGGAQQRTNSLFMFFPDSNDAVVVLTNTYIKDFPQKELGEILLELISELNIDSTAPDWKPIPRILNNPNILYPRNKDTLESLTDTLKWSLIENAHQYICEYDQNKSFSNSFKDTVYNNFLEMNELEQGKKYFWRVKAINTFLYEGVESNWSEIYEFMTPSNTNVDFYSKKGILVYPNPSSSVINIESEFSIKSVEIINAFGYNVKTVISKNKIDLTGMSRGVYYLRIHDIDGSIWFEKIVYN